MLNQFLKILNAFPVKGMGADQSQHPNIKKQETYLSSLNLGLISLKPLGTSSATPMWS